MIVFMCRTSHVLQKVRKIDWDRSRLRKILLAARGREEDVCQNIFSVRRICHYSDFFISWIQRLLRSTRLNCSVKKLICWTQITEQRGRQARPKHHTYKDYLSKLKTQPEKLLHVSEVTGCCFISSFQGLEDSKDLSTVSFQRLLDLLQLR